jgi:Sec-independent protein translocase protein TatA
MMTIPTALFADIFGGWEIVLSLAVVLILFGAKRFPDISRWIDGVYDAGKSLGGIYGKPAAEALTPDNETAEHYNPSAFEKEEKTARERKLKRFFGWFRWLRQIWHSVLKCLKIEK